MRAKKEAKARIRPAIGYYTLHYDSFDKSQDLNDINVIRQISVKHGEDYVVLYVGPDNAMANFTFHGRPESEEWANEIADAERLKVREEMLKLPDHGFVTVGRMQKLLNSVGIKEDNLKENLYWREEGEED